MKTLKTILIALLVGATFLTSCSKDDENPAPTPTTITPTLPPSSIVYPEQSPLTGYLKTSGFEQKVIERKDFEDAESGYSFIPLVSGKINAVSIKIPDIRTGLRVTIWNKETKAVLRTETIDITKANTEFVKTIEPLALTKNKEYFISFNSNDYYQKFKKDDSNTTYPITVGDIKITSHITIVGTSQTFPNQIVNNFFVGDVDFKFQRTE